MKKLIMIILFCRFGIDLLIGQNLFNTGLSIPYDPCTGCSENNPTNPVYRETTYFNNAPEVKSDFGPRYVVRSSGDVPYDWHGGIDYSSV